MACFFRASFIPLPEMQWVNCLENDEWITVIRLTFLKEARQMELTIILGCSQLKVYKISNIPTEAQFKRFLKFLCMRICSRQKSWLPGYSRIETQAASVTQCNNKDCLLWMMHLHLAWMWTKYQIPNNSFFENIPNTEYKLYYSD